MIIINAFNEIADIAIIRRNDILRRIINELNNSNPTKCYIWYEQLNDDESLTVGN